MLLGKQLLALLSPQETPSMSTFATIGQETHDALSKSGCIFELEIPPLDTPASDCAPIATPADIRRLVECPSEKALVEAFTPLLQIARFGEVREDGSDPCKPLLVNSENHPWLDALHSPQSRKLLKKPDLFVTAEPCWSGYRHSRRGPEGTLAARALQLDSAVCEFYDAKLGDGNLNYADFGQLVDYHSRVRGSVYGMLFNARCFWLFESVRDKPVRLIKGELGALGSRAAVRRFFAGKPEVPLVTLMRLLMRDLGVVSIRLNKDSADADVAGTAAFETVAHMTALAAASGDSSTTDSVAAVAAALTAAKKSSTGQSFLGAGAEGRIFAVRLLSDNSVRVLKVVIASVTASRAMLESEFRLISGARESGAPVANVMDDSLKFYYNSENGLYLGGGYLLADVLTPVFADRANCTAVVRALKALHDAGYVHGDARLQNLMCSADGTLLWIDFRESFISAQSAALDTSRLRDAKTLARSILGLSSADELPGNVTLALSILSDAAESYDALASAIRFALSIP